MFSIFKKKLPQFFSSEEQQKIVEAIRNAEQRTSGEIRVYVESKCRFVDAIDRAAEIFYGLKMEATAERNAVLVYVAMKHRQFAVFADEGIYKKADADFWKEKLQIMLAHFNKENYADGITTLIKEIGEALAYHFPYQADIDKNELPDEIVFGK
ncbi:MAG: TPM domain-containing protein [Chitinophagaceae bacterium]